MRRLISATFALAVVVLVPSLTSAQAAPRQANKAVYLELGGNGLWYSINYELGVRQNSAVRVGFSYMSVSAASGTAESSISSLGVPVTFSYFLGAGNHRLEIGGGVLLEKFSGAASSGFGEKAEGGGFYPLATGIFGYRYRPVNGGLNFKLAFTPVWHPDLGTFIWGGMSLGMGF
jgi:hypothetical protein